MSCDWRERKMFPRKQKRREPSLSPRLHLSAPALCLAAFRRGPLRGLIPSKPSPCGPGLSGYGTLPAVRDAPAPSRFRVPVTGPPAPGPFGPLARGLRSGVAAACRFIGQPSHPPVSGLPFRLSPVLSGAHRLSLTAFRRGCVASRFIAALRATSPFPGPHAQSKRLTRFGRKQNRIIIHRRVIRMVFRGSSGTRGTFCRHPALLSLRIFPLSAGNRDFRL